MKRPLIFFTAIFFASSLWLSAHQRLSAQETPEFEQLTSDYSFQLERQRQATQDFNFEKAEFHKLQTLASQEDAVAKLKELLIARDQTLRSYLAILDYLLTNTQGIDIAKKSTSTTKLQEAITILENHSQSVPGVFEKDAVLASSAELESQSELLSEAQHRAMSLISIGRIQTQLDQLVVISNEFQDTFVENIPNESLKAATIRGLKEVGDRLREAQASIDQANTLYDEFDDERLSRRRSPGRRYEGIVDYLRDSHSAMLRATDFITELEQSI